MAKRTMARFYPEEFSIRTGERSEQVEKKAGVNLKIMSFRTAIVAAIFPVSAAAESPILSLPTFPDYVILGLGAGPKYMGSDSDVWAVVPAARKSFGQRYASLEANYLSINLANNPNWQAGPAGILRFGRSDTGDQKIDMLPDVDMSVDLGGFVAWENTGDDPRNRWRIGAGLLHDATGVHDGYVADVNIRRWVPIGEYAALGIGLAASWGSENYMDSYFSVNTTNAATSGLAEYDADAGWRDARLTAILVQPVSPKWAVGAGFMYARLLDDPANSPIVQSRDQLYAGVGVARAW